MNTPTQMNNQQLNPNPAAPSRLGELKEELTFEEVEKP